LLIVDFATSAVPGSEPIIVAHRGLHHHFPENSLEAFRAAVEAGFEWVEFDIQAASDGTPVIIHDETLDRTTMCTGRVTSRRGEELRHVRMRLGDQPHAGRLPVLKDPPALSSLNAWLLVEIKPPDAEDLVRRVASRLRSIKARFMLQSFDAKNVLHAQRHAPDVPRALLIESIDELAKAVTGPWGMINVQHDLVEHALVKKLHDQGRRIGVWTPNSAAELKRTVQLGVDMIITDEPQLARTIVEESSSSGGP
jgi:glycerophosphoryl diester phosphodiesterase